MKNLWIFDSEADGLVGLNIPEVALSGILGGLGAVIGISLLFLVISVQTILSDDDSL